MQAVIGLGGSAGSISPLQAFFSRMPTDSGLAFVVVLHLSPEHESSLAALLQKRDNDARCSSIPGRKGGAELRLCDPARQESFDGRRSARSQ